MQLTDAATLTRKMMNEHGLGHWMFEWDKSVRRFGCCHRGEKKITLSEYLVRLNTEERVLHTIVHEIAHALTPGDHHGPKWKAKCRELGIKDTRCYSREDTNIVRGSWVGICRTCGYQAHKFKKPRGRVACKSCCAGRGFMAEYELLWTNPGFDPRAAVMIQMNELDEDAA